MKLKSFFLLAVLLISSICNVSAQQGSSNGVEKNLVNFDPNKPLFKLNDEQAVNTNRLMRFIAVTGYREGVVPTKHANSFGIGFNVVNNTQTGTKGIFIHNSSIEDLITLCLTPPSHVLLNVKDPSRYRYEISYGDQTNWLRKNGYCYEQMFPEINMTLDQLVQDIANSFGLRVEKKKIIVKSLVLMRTSQKEKFKTTADGEGIYSETEFINQPIRRIGEFIESNGSKLPFVDKTNYSGYVDLNFKDVSWKDISSIRKALQKYDLDIVEKNAEVEMLVISELKK